MRSNLADSLDTMDIKIWTEVNDRVTARACEAIQRGLDPDSKEGRDIAEEYLKGWVRAHRIEPDAEFFARMRRKHFDHKQNLKRYWELVEKVGGLKARSAPTPEWIWIGKAARLLLADMPK